MGSLRNPLGDAASKAVYNTHHDVLPAIQRSPDLRMLELLVGYVVTRRIGCGHRRHARFRPSTISRSQQLIEAISFTGYRPWAAQQADRLTLWAFVKEELVVDKTRLRLDRADDLARAIDYRSVDS